MKKTLIFLLIILFLLATSGCIEYSKNGLEITVNSNKLWCATIDSYEEDEEFIIDINGNNTFCGLMDLEILNKCEISLNCVPDITEGKCVCKKINWMRTILDYSKNKTIK